MYPNFVMYLSGHPSVCECVWFTSSQSNLRTIKGYACLNKRENSISASGAQRMKSRPLDPQISLGLPHSCSEDRETVKQGFVCVLMTF